MIRMLQQEISSPSFEAQLISEYDTGITLNLRGIYISPDDNKKIFIAEYGGGDRIIRYDMTTANDLNTISLHSSVYSGVSTGPFGLTFRPDGSEFFVFKISNNPNVLYRKSLPVNWELSSVVSVSSSQTISYFYPYSIVFSGDGLSLFIAGNSSGIREYTLTSPYDITTRVLSNTYNLNSSSFSFAKNGEIAVFRVGYNLKVYKLNTPYSLSDGFTYIDEVNMGWSIIYFSITEDGEYLYAIRKVGTVHKIIQYKMTYTNI